MLGYASRRWRVRTGRFASGDNGTERAAVPLLRLARRPRDQHGEQDACCPRRRLPSHERRRIGDYGTKRKRPPGFRPDAGRNPQFQVRSSMQNQNEVDPMTPAPAPDERPARGHRADHGAVRRGRARGHDVGHVLHVEPGIPGHAQRARGTARLSPSPNIGLNSEISNWDRVAQQAERVSHRHDRFQPGVRRQRRHGLGEGLAPDGQHVLGRVRGLRQHRRGRPRSAPP